MVLFLVSAALISNSSSHGNLTTGTVYHLQISVFHSKWFIKMPISNLYPQNSNIYRTGMFGFWNLHILTYKPLQTYLKIEINVQKQYKHCWKLLWQDCQNFLMYLFTLYVYYTYNKKFVHDWIKWTNNQQHIYSAIVHLYWCYLNIYKCVN